MESSFAPKLGNRGEIWRGDSRKPQVIGAPKTIFFMEFGAKLLKNEISSSLQSHSRCPSLSLYPLKNCETHLLLPHPAIKWRPPVSNPPALTLPTLPPSCIPILLSSVCFITPTMLQHVYGVIDCAWLCGSQLVHWKAYSIVHEPKIRYRYGTGR